MEPGRRGSIPHGGIVIQIRAGGSDRVYQSLQEAMTAEYIRSPYATSFTVDGTDVGFEGDRHYPRNTAVIDNCKIVRR